MSLYPEPPAAQHVWVRGHSEHGPPNAGVIMCWQHTPLNKITAPEWAALVVQAPFGTALLVDWVSADRLVPIRDDTATAGRPTLRPASPPLRHAWVHGGAGLWHPCLVLEWRRSKAAGWEAHAVAVRQNSLLLTWTPASEVRPVTDDRWELRR